MRCWEVVQLVGLQTLDLAILVRVQASQPIFLLAAEGLAVFLQFRFPVPTKNLVGQPPEVIRTACPSPFGTILWVPEIVAGQFRKFWHGLPFPAMSPPNSDDPS